ncbi:MAG: hypothetical protein ACI4US_00415 [Muribaculaceae bacterium]
MKKLSIFFACAAAMFGLTSCEQNTDPKLTIPEDHSFVLNQPAFADQYLQLTQGNSFEVTCTQPDYGYAATATYGMQVSLTEDFADYRSLNPVNPALAKIEILDQDLALALCELHGFTASNYQDLPAEKIYLRATCEIKGIEGTECVSNVITLNNVKFYLAIMEPGQIYLVGSPNKWPAPDPESEATLSKWQLNETGIGTGIFYNTFKLPAGENMFRFYRELTGWDGGASLGSQAEDNPIDIQGDFLDGIYDGPAVNGKGSWKFNLDKETMVGLTVDTNNMTVRIDITGNINYDVLPCMYIIGNVSGWKGPEEANAGSLADWRIYDMDGSGVYVSRPDKPFTYTEAPMFRIYSELTGWDGGASLGAQEADSPVDATVTNGVFSGSYVSGKGSWNFPGVGTSGTFSVSLDTNTQQLTVTFNN